jgi:hypothetical protein
MANAAHITRRSIFKLAPAVLATGGAVVAFPAKSEPLTLDQEINACLSKLRDLVLKKYPKTNFLNHDFASMRDGGFVFTMLGLAPKIEWSGAGYYEIWLAAKDTNPTLMWVDQQWCHMDQAYGYRAYVRENGQQVSASEYFTEQSLCIHRKL